MRQPFSARSTSMSPRHGCLAFVAFLLMASPVFAQAQDCRALQQLRAQTYGFRTSQISKEQREQKTADLERFWSQVKKEGNAGVECLREMLRNQSGDPFFLFDGSSLLFQLDKSETSTDAIVQALSGTDLKEVDPAEYLRLLIALRHEGVDIGPLALKYLAYPKVDVYLPEPAMKLDRKSGATLLYGSMPPVLASRYLIAALDAKEEYVRSTATYVLALQMTEDSFKALHGLAQKNALPEENRSDVLIILKYQKPSPVSTVRLSRREVLEKLTQIPAYDESFPGVAGNTEFQASASAILTDVDLPALLTARRKSVRGISGGFLDEYLALSNILLEVINRFDVYQAYRIR